MKSFQENISINKDIRSGQACIKNTRITVADILDYLASGMSNTEILEDFPELSNEDILSALAFAAESQKRTSTLETAALYVSKSIIILIMILVIFEKLDL